MTSEWVEYYNELWEIRDRRIDGWFLMDSFIPTLALSAFYVISVTILGPWYMRDKKPYDPKWIMQIYNFIQVALSGYIVYEACAAGWTNHYNYGELFS